MADKIQLKVPIFGMVDIELREQKIEVPEDLFVDMREFEFSQKVEYANSSVSFGTRKHNGAETSVVLKEPTRLGSHEESDPEKIYFLCDFVNEVVAQSKLKHPCILPILGIKLFDNDGLFAPGIITPRMKGSADELKEMDDEDVWIWGIGVADAMALANENGIMHRDLKPENIFVGELEAESGSKDGGRFVKWPFLGDFGYATAIDDGDLCFYPFGTPGYKAPEMAPPEDGCQASYDARCDVFSYGVTMWAIAEAKLCEDAAKQQEFLDSGGRLEFVTENGQQMKDLLYQCMASDPEDRPRFEYISKQMKYLAGKMKKNVAKRVDMFVNELEREKDKIGKAEQEVCIFGHDLGNEVIHIVPFLEAVLGRLFPKSFEGPESSRGYFPLSNFVCSYLEKQSYTHGKDFKDLLIVFYNSERELLDLAQGHGTGMTQSKQLNRLAPMKPQGPRMPQSEKIPSPSRTGQLTVQPHFSWNRDKTELQISILRAHVRVNVPEIVKRVQVNFTPDKKTVVLYFQKACPTK